MTKKIFNWGIVAPGKIAHKFVQDLLTLPNARVHAVASRSLDRAEVFAKQYGATHAYGNYEAMTDCPDLDVVYIASPHNFHCAHSLLFLNKKISVLCEKPMGVDEEEVAKMIQAARQQKTYLMEALWTRFLPMTEKVLALLKEDAIGEVKTVQADFGFEAVFNAEGRLFNPALAGGALLDIGIYPAFLATLILGLPQNILRAEADFGRTKVDETNDIILDYRNGKKAILQASILEDLPTIAEIYGTKGKITIPSRWHEAKSCTLEKKDGAIETFHFDYEQRGYHAEAAAVMKDLTLGKQENEKWTLNLSLELITLLDQIKQGFLTTKNDGNV